MDMKTISYIIAGLVGVLLSGCEKILEFEGEITEPKIVITALANPDTLFSVRIAHSTFFTYVSPEDQDAIIDGVPVSADERAIIKDAGVSCTVNGTQTFSMPYNPDTKSHESGYRPLPGDRITLNVAAEGYADAGAEVEMPARVRLEILGKEVLYSKVSVVYDEWVESGLDTIMRIRMKLVDPPGVANYYRLKVRSMADYTAVTPDETIEGYLQNDVFTSSDVIFQDERLVKRYGGWPAGFSNVFDDHLFDGKEYECFVETRMPGENNPRVVVELQSITRDFYNYLKSVMLYRITDRDSYTESIQIYSNVDGGYGILGGLSGEKSTLLWR